MDLILSSGFLAFARHAGVLRAVEDSDLRIDGVCGTSSGAIAGALWLAGHSASDIAEELCAQRPLSMCTPHAMPWRGLFTLDRVIQRLELLLPERFEDLDRPFGVGVIRPNGSHRLVTSGPLAPAVAASMAIPRLFVPIELDGELCADGAFADRTAFEPWRAYRGEPAVFLHAVASSRDDQPPVDLPAPTVHTPRSGARLWSLGDYRQRVDEAHAIALDVIAGLGDSSGGD